MAKMNTKPAVERSEHVGEGIEMQTFLGRKRMLRCVESEDE